VSRSTLCIRMSDTTSRAEIQPKNRLLNELEEKVLLQHILDLDAWGFSSKVEGVEDIANYIFKTRPVSKLWAHCFIKCNSELKTRFSRSYDFQRALCEDSKLIEEWFQRVVNIKAKYKVQDCDIWNFDEMGFMIRVISSSIVVTQADRKGRRKRVQLDNKEWATAIACINTESHDISPFLLVKSTYYLANWYTKGALLHNWVIKLTENG
jgi:hypothetical protein